MSFLKINHVTSYVVGNGIYINVMHNGVNYKFRGWRERFECLSVDENCNTNPNFIEDAVWKKARKRLKRHK